MGECATYSSSGKIISNFCEEVKALPRDSSSSVRYPAVVCDEEVSQNDWRCYCGNEHLLDEITEKVDCENYCVAD